MFKRIVVIAGIVTLLLLAGCSGDPTAILTLMNNTSSHVLLGLWVVPSSSDTWGNTVMSTTLSPGNTWTGSIPAGDSIDFATESSTHEWEIYNAVIAEGEEYNWEILDADATPL